MKTPFALLGLVVCALPLLASQTERRVAAPCELTTASVIASGKETEAAGREFAVRVINNSPQTIALPSSPAFGWRVESLERGTWRLQAEGGPVRRVHSGNEQDGHVVVIGDPASAPLLQIAPGLFKDFYTFLPEAAPALRPEATNSTLKLTLLWAAPAALVLSNHAVPLCALAPEFVLKLQKLPPPH
jgi:hypothetical protein